MQQKTGTHSNIPVRGTSLILAGIRADKHHHLTFPCIQHSGIEGWLARITSCACSPLRGQHTQANEFALCFPFNRQHDYVGEHQNCAILPR
jgi:hypothetical protein